MGIFNRKSSGGHSSEDDGADTDESGVKDSDKGDEEVSSDSGKAEPKAEDTGRTADKFKIDMELLHESEFQRETDVRAQAHAPEKINLAADSGYVYAQRPLTSVNTLYDQNGRILLTLPNVNRTFIFDDEFLKIEEYLQKFIPQGYRGLNECTDVNLPPGADIFPSNAILAAIHDKFVVFMKKYLGYSDITQRMMISYFWQSFEDFRENNRIIFQKDYTKYYDALKSFPSENSHFSVSCTSGGKDTFLAKARTESDSAGLFGFDCEALKKSIGFTEKGNLFLLDWSKDDPKAWEMKRLEFSVKDKELSAPIPNPFIQGTAITGAGLDPRGNFVLVAFGNVLKVYDWHTSPMTEVASSENPDGNFEGHISEFKDGTIVAGDKDGNLRKIHTNLAVIPSFDERQEQEKLIQRLRAKKRVRTEPVAGAAAEAAPLAQEFVQSSNDILAQFTADIDSADTLEKIKKIKDEAASLRVNYSTDITDKGLLTRIFKPLMDKIAAKEGALLSKHIEVELAGVRKAVEGIAGLSLTSLTDMTVKAGRLKSDAMAAGVDADVRKEVVDLCDLFSEKALEILKADEDSLIQHIDQIYTEQENNLSAMTKYSEFEIWVNVDYPIFLGSMTNQLRIFPASHVKLIKHCRDVETKMRELKKKYTVKFKEQYETVRQTATASIDLMIGLAADRIDEFLESFSAEVNKKHFDGTDSANEWVERSALYSAALAGIDDIEKHDPDKARELRQSLKVGVAQLAFRAKQLKDVKIEDATGRQMAVFGDAVFPVWEHKIEGKGAVKIDLVFKQDKGRKAGENLREDICELYFKITTGNGKVKEIPFHEEDIRKYGYVNEEGGYFPSLMTVAEAQKIISAIKKMESKDSELKKQYNDFQNKIRMLNAKIAERKGDELRPEREALTKEYIKFLQESGIYAWLRLKNFRTSYKNGKAAIEEGQGIVPDLPSYLVEDKDADKILQEFSEAAQMCLELKAGMISLEGHAGTGKDVIIDMFCAKTQRPKFVFDCSNWTTEFELSQDVSLAAEEGASFTVKEDSIVVKALETPGAVLYFNEFNAMKRPAQIFLHSLFAKRQISLKTSGGRVVTAHPSVIICGSMNPGYPDTYHPQMATRRRMVPIKVGYPEFKREDGTYSPSEALRAARSIKSLEDLTIDPDMSKNEFIQLWEKYINKGQDDSLLTPERKFDMEVLFALVTFGNNIREGFFKYIDKTAERDDFIATQPFTLSEMQRAAYLLSRMDPREKGNLNNAETGAKNLIRRIYAPYIFVKEEADKLETQLKLWTTQKPAKTP